LLPWPLRAAARLTDDEGIDKDQLYLIQQYLKSAAEREQEERETEQIAEEDADNKEGGTGTRAKGEEGSMGNPNSKATNKRYAVQVRKTTRIRTSPGRRLYARLKSSA